MEAVYYVCVIPNSCNLIDTKTNKAVIMSSLINLLWWSIGHHRPTRSATGTTVPTVVLSAFCSMCLRGRLWVRSYLSPRLFVFVHLQTWGCAGVKGESVVRPPLTGTMWPANVRVYVRTIRNIQYITLWRQLCGMPSVDSEVVLLSKVCDICHPAAVSYSTRYHQFLVHKDGVWLVLF